MGFGDMVSKILLEVRADTSDAKAKLKDLAGEEKKLAQARLEGINASNKQLEDWVGNIGKAGLALGAVAGATGIALRGIKEFGNEMRLTAAAGSANIERLQNAFDGLVPKMDVLTFAAQSQRGVLKLNQDQMETLAKGAVALSRGGMGELNDVLEKLKNAAVKAKAEGLDDLGLRVRQGSTETETLANIMAELNRKIAENGNMASSAADDVQRLAVAWENAKSGLLSFVGASFSLQATKEGRGALFWLANIGTLGGAARSVDNNATRMANESQSALGPLNAGSSVDDFGNYTGPARRFGVSAKEALDAAKQMAAEQGSMFDAYGSASKAATEWAKEQEAASTRATEKAKQLAEVHRKIAIDLLGGSASDRGASRGIRQAAADRAAWQADIDRMVEQMYRQERYDRRTILGDDTLRRQIDYGSAQSNIGRAGGGIQAMQDNLRQLQYDLTKGREQKFLESAFGKLEDFNAYATAFQMLSGSVSAGMNAWIDGSMSAGEAVKKFLADSLKGLASSMAVEALKHGAYAIGSLAFGDVRGASTHAAAAAAFGAGAAAAAVAARTLGGGAQTPTGGGAGAGGAGASGSAGDSRDHRTGQGSDATRPIIMILGSQYDKLTPRQRRIEADEAFERALRERDE